MTPVKRSVIVVISIPVEIAIKYGTPKPETRTGAFTQPPPQPTIPAKEPIARATAINMKILIE